MAHGNEGQKIFLREKRLSSLHRGASTVRQRYSFSLYLCLDAESLPLAVGGSSFSDGAYPAIAANRLSPARVNLRVRDDRREQHPPFQAAT